MNQKDLENQRSLNTGLKSNTDIVQSDCLNKNDNSNSHFTDYINKTALRIAEGGKTDKVDHLEEGNTTISNKKGKADLEGAKELKPEGEIGEMIETQVKNVRNLDNAEAKADIIKENEMNDDERSFYQKRAGTTGIKGELYETKLLSLILIRASIHRKLEKFYLGTSLQGIGALDDICLRYTLNEEDSVVFLQAKHDIKGKVSHKNLYESTSNYSLPKYFHSYMKIREKFDSTAVDNMFQGKYEETNCHFVIYTTALEEMKDKKKNNLQSLDKTIKELISTGDHSNIFQYKYIEDDVEKLTSIILEERMELMGKKLFYFLQGTKYKNMLLDRHIREFHHVLATKVFCVSDTVNDDARTGSFNDDFLSTDDELLTSLKETLFKEFVTATKVVNQDLLRIAFMASEKNSVEDICNLLKNASTSYDKTKNKLKILDLKISLSVPSTLYSEAHQMAIKEKLGKLNFKLPSAFGNCNTKVRTLNTESTLKDFLDNLWFYTRQGKENEIEEYAKADLDKFYDTKQNTHIQSEAIFLKIHNEVQKWWQIENKARYLTKNYTSN